MAHLSSTEYDADELALQPFKHLSQKAMSSKFLVSRLWTEFNLWYECPEEKMLESHKFLKNLLNIVYLSDDLIDDSVLRRGEPAAHLVFGRPRTIYGVIYAAASVQQEKILTYDYKEEIFDAYIRVSWQISQNQGMIIYFRNNCICPTYDEYGKYLTGNGWFLFSIKLLKIHGKKNVPDVSDSLHDKISVFVQVYNDYLNVQSSEYSKLKCWCEDLTSGNFTFHVIHAIQSHPEDDRILNMMKARPRDIEEKKRFVKILEELGSFEFARATMRRLKLEIIDEAEKIYLSKHPRLEQVFDNLLDNLENDSEMCYDILEHE